MVCWGCSKLSVSTGSRSLARRAELDAAGLAVQAGRSVGAVGRIVGGGDRCGQMMLRAY